MHRVVPWPQPGGAGFINAHYQFVKTGVPFTETKGLPWAGRAFNSLSEFMGYVNWMNAKPESIKNIFYCLSRQSQHGGFTNGKAKAARSAQNAEALKAIWLDVDVKEAPKGYPTLQEAARAVYVFCKSARLPEPSALVKSGGGLHAYWISERELSVDEWRPYAEGLKALAIQHGLRCDAGVTSDPARILRVPGTYNFKETVPREVQLIHLMPADLDFAKHLGHIAVNVPVTATVTKPAQIDLSGITVTAAFKAAFSADDALSKGIDSVKEVLLNWGLVEAGCPFFKDAKATGGKEHDQPLWNLAILATTFFEEGETLAHELGNGYPTYSVAETDKMYARKAAEQKKNNLGWPSCASIESNGCKLCAGCPHKSKIRSPLELGKTHPTPAPHVNASTSPASLAMHLPGTGRYFVDDDGYLCEWQEVKGKGGDPGEQLPIRLLDCVIKNPRTQGDPHPGIQFDAHIDISTWKRCTLYQSEATTAEVVRSLGKQGVHINVRAEGRLREFFMSWIAELNKKIAATKNRAFGWIHEDGVPVGFSFGGTTYYRDGKEEPSSLPDPVLRKMYEPMGSIETWKKALALITGQKRPHLEAMVAMAFATPMLWATGGAGGTFAVYGKSGANKTSACKVALAVWGDPITTKMKPNSTVMAIEDRLGSVDCLPIIVDDAQKDSDFQTVCGLVFDATSGVNKSRMKQNATMVEPKKSSSGMLCTANNSFYDYMINVERVTSEAKLARALEMEVPKPENQIDGRMSQTDAEMILNALEFNHGAVGIEYVKWLVANLDEAKDYCREVSKRIETTMAMREQERFWKSFTSAILCGAYFAERALDIKFDLEGIEKALLQAYMRCRQRIEDAQVEGTSQSSVEAVVSAFISRYYDHQIWTVGMATNKGGRHVPVVHQGMEPKRTPVHIQWCVEEKFLRFNKPLFVDFLIQGKYPTSSILEGLERHFGMQSKKLRLAGGTAWPAPPAIVCQMQIGVRNFLEATLYQRTEAERVPDHVSRSDAITPDMQAPAPEELTTEKFKPIDTGLLGDVVAAGIAQAEIDAAKIRGVT